MVQAAIEFKRASVDHDLKAIEFLARIILPEVYEGNLDEEHTNFFIQKFLSKQSLKKALSAETSLFLICRTDLEDHYAEKEAIGFLGFKGRENDFLLDKLYILEDYRGQGIGLKALKFAEEKAIKMGFEEIVLFANCKNPRSINFYETHGYQVKERLENTYENGYVVEDFKMQKTFNASALN